MRTEKQKQACAENNVIRALGSLQVALNQARLFNIKSWETARREIQENIDASRRLRKGTELK